MVQQDRFDEFSETEKPLDARRVSPAMACPCQKAQQRGRALLSSPEGSHPDDPIQRCSPCKGLAIHCVLRLVLNHPGDSEPIKPILLDH